MIQRGDNNGAEDPQSQAANEVGVCLPLGEDVTKAISELEHFAIGLEITGRGVLNAAGLTLVLVIALNTFPVTRVLYPFNVVIQALGALFPLMGLWMLFKWDRRRRYGMALFEEISDEVEWAHRTHRVVSSGLISYPIPPDIPTRTPLGVRRTLRKFLNAATLPLVPSSSGASLYLVYFLVVLLFIVVRVSFIWKL